MFAARLDAAAKAARADCKPMSPMKPTPASSSSSDPPAEHKTAIDTDGPAPEKQVQRGDDAGSKSGSINSRNDNGSKAADAKTLEWSLPAEEEQELLEAMTEYLFDLFDANCTEGYKRLAEIEEEAMSLFKTNDSQEYTLEMSAMHDKFVSTFESLMEGFLVEQGISNDQFYSMLARHAPRRSGNASIRWDDSKDSGCGPAAEEVLCVVSQALDFEQWAVLMREQARRRAAFVPFSQRL